MTEIDRLLSDAEPSKNWGANIWLKRAGAVIAAGAALYACSAVTGYDNDVHPSAGLVTASPAPVEDCRYRAAKKRRTCEWIYWLYVDGCQELSPGLVEAAKEQEEDWEPARGWVEVSGQTWASFPAGTEIIFAERNLINSIVVFGSQMGGHTAQVESCE